MVGYSPLLAARLFRFISYYEIFMATEGWLLVWLSALFFSRREGTKRERERVVTIKGDAFQLYLDVADYKKLPHNKLF